MHSFASAASTVRGTQALGISGHAKTADNRQQQSAIPTSFCIQHAGLWTNSRDDDTAYTQNTQRHHLHTQQHQQQPKAPDAALTTATPQGVVSSSPLPSRPQTPTLGSPSNPMNISGVLSPQLAYDKAVETGASKAAYQPWKTFLLGNLAGVYVGFGSFLAFTVGANLQEMAISNPGLQKFLYGAVGLPAGLVMVLVCGAELYTSNTALMPVAYYEKKATMQQLLRNWAISYSGNFVGALALVGLVASSGAFSEAAAVGPCAIAEYKCHHTWLQAMTRGMLCNWLVCIAVWQANAANTLGGKAIGVWLPISAFVTMGLEHCVANMFMIPCGMSLGANITTYEFLVNNLIPVTIGNTIAGATFVGTAYSLAYGGLGKRVSKVFAKYGM